MTVCVTYKEWADEQNTSRGLLDVKLVFNLVCYLLVFPKCSAISRSVVFEIYHATCILALHVLIKCTLVPVHIYLWLSSS